MDFNIFSDDRIVEFIGQLQHGHDVVNAVFDPEIAGKPHLAEFFVHEADVNVVIAIQFGDDLFERIVFETETAVNPIDRPFGGRNIRQLHSFRFCVEYQLLGAILQSS